MGRKVSFSTFIDLLKEKKVVYGMSKVFLIIGFFILSIVSFITYISANDSYEDYDSEEILSKGKAVKAEVIYLKEITNITVNNEHPVEIYYKYKNNGKLLQDTFQTLEIEKVYDLESGSIIDVKTYKNQSVIVDIEPFSFPMSFVFFFPIFFLIIAFILLSITLIPALRKRKLYKEGILTDAHFMGYSAVAVTPLSDKRLVNVDYYYFSNGNKIFGNSITDDWLYLPQTKREEIIKIFVSSENPNLSCYIPRRTAIKNNWNINFN